MANRVVLLLATATRSVWWAAASRPRAPTQRSEWRAWILWWARSSTSSSTSTRWAPAPLPLSRSLSLPSPPLFPHDQQTLVDSKLVSNAETPPGSQETKINHHTFGGIFDLTAISYLQPSFSLRQDQWSFSITQHAFMHLCAAPSPFRAVYVSGWWD